MARAIVLATASDQPEITASDRLYAGALERRGFSVVGAPWDGPRAAFDGAAAVVIRSTWGYYRAMRRLPRLDRGDGRRDAACSIRSRWCAGTCARITSASWPPACVRVPRTYFVACEAGPSRRSLARPAGGRAVVKPMTGGVGLFRRTGDAGEVRNRWRAWPPRRASERRAGAGISSRDRRWRTVDGLFRRHLQSRHPQAAAAGRVQESTRASAPTRSAETPPRRGDGAGRGRPARAARAAALCPGRRRRARRCADRDRGRGAGACACSWSSIRRRPSASPRRRLRDSRRSRAVRLAADACIEPKIAF